MLCEPHDRVLVHWLRAAREGRLPRSGVTVIHFDAHPDLSVPQGPLPRGFPDDVRPLLAASNIASFQLAAVWAGLVSRIVWIRPEFAGEIQLPDGARRFRLGETASGALRVDDRSDHYVLDGAYAPTAELRGAVEIEVEVLPLSAALRRGPLATGPAILDVDLDGFATHNPGARRLREAGLAEADLENLRAIFSPARLALAEDPVQRVRDLDAVLGAVGSLAQRRFREWPGALLVLYRSGVGLGGLARLAAIAWRVPDGLEPERFLEDGRLLVALPERTAVPRAEIEATASALAELLRSGAVRPALVTVARSVEDGYTPREEWPRIEWTFLRALAGALGSAPLRLDDGVRPAPRAD